MINDHRDQGDLHEPSDCDHEHNDARSPRQETALLEVCESRHLADDDDLVVDANLEKGRGRGGRVMIMTKVHLHTSNSQLFYVDISEELALLN